MKTVVVLLSLTAALTAQTGATQTDTIRISVNWPNRDIIRTKYGSLPASIYPGEVTGCNEGASTLVFSQGLVIQALKTQALEAYTRTDAIAVIGASQRGAFRSRWLQWSPVALSALNVFTGGLATGLISSSTLLKQAAVGLTELANRELPVVNSGLSVNPNLTYEADGMTNIMQLTPKGTATACATGTIMFATPGGAPGKGSTGPSFSVEASSGTAGQ